MWVLGGWLLEEFLPDQAVLDPLHRGCTFAPQFTVSSGQKPCEEKAEAMWRKGSRENPSSGVWPFLLLCSSSPFAPRPHTLWGDGVILLLGKLHESWSQTDKDVKKPFKHENFGFLINWSYSPVLLFLTVSCWTLGKKWRISVFFLYALTLYKHLLTIIYKDKSVNVW